MKGSLIEKRNKITFSSEFRKRLVCLDHNEAQRPDDGLEYQGADHIIEKLLCNSYFSSPNQ